MWKSTCVEAEKLRFIALRLAGAGMTELCASFGISRQAGYELMAAFERVGLECVKSRSRARLTQKRAATPEQEAMILALRGERPTWGPKKLKAALEADHPDLTWPAASGIGTRIKSQGLVPDRRRRRTPLPRQRPFAEVREPNDLWCIDFKGWFRTGDGTRCDPLTVSDADSRFLLGCRIVAPTHAGVFPEMQKLFKEMGLPRAIRSDNGPPFGSVAPGGLTRLGVHWIKLGIALEKIDPGEPQQNGRHERMHATLKAEAVDPPAADPDAQQARFDAFRETFNRVRPHEALGQKPPASVYHPSARPYPDRIEEPTYTSEEAVRRVRSNGCIKWNGELVFLSEALIGEPVGIAETDTGAFLVRFADVDLGLIDRSASKLTPFAPPRPGRRKRAPEQTGKSVTHVPGP